MKKILVMALAILVGYSCTKEEAGTNDDRMRACEVSVSLKNSPLTRASGSGHGVKADDNNIQTLEIFIFRSLGGGAGDGMLDGYARFTKEQLGNLQGLKVKSTTGQKVIYAVANSHKAHWNGVSTLSDFKKQLASVKEDNLKDFLMTGQVSKKLELVNQVEIPVQRMVSRVSLKSVKTAFAGTPYAGKTLKDVKVYLINVQGQKLVHDGSGSNLKVINKGAYVAKDAEGAAMADMFYDTVEAPVGDAGHSTAHYFYCYENNIGEESSLNRFTRLVVEGTLDGVKYYYPVSIPQLQRNSCYAVDVTIRRPGAQTPDEILQSGSITASIKVLDWKVIPDMHVEF